MSDYETDTTMTEIPQAALDAGAAALAEDGCRTGATHGIDTRTVLEAAAPFIRADERRRVAEEIQGQMPETGSQICMTPYREGLAAGVSRCLQIAEYAAHIVEKGSTHV